MIEMYVDGFDGSDQGDFGAIEAALREARVKGASGRMRTGRRSVGNAVGAGRVAGFDPALPGGGAVPRISSSIPPVRPLDIPSAVPPGPPSFPDGGETEPGDGETEPGDGGEFSPGGLPPDGDRLPSGSKAAPAAEWYKKPWPWIVLAAVLGGAVILLASRGRGSGVAGLGASRRRIPGARLVLLDLRSELFYAWRGGNVLCAFDREGREVACWSMAEPTIRAARDLARKKIRAYHEPDRERWLERDPRFAG